MTQVNGTNDRITQVHDACLRLSETGQRLPVSPCGQPLVPTGPPSPVRIFSNHTAPAGAPLRNRTVDLLLTIDNQQTRGQQRPWTECYPACASVAWKVWEWLGE